MYKAEILADSLNPQGDRLTTMKITFPRFILAEMNTHRMFSRNSASSRAIPFNKMVKLVMDNPFIPIAWQKDHKGMQGTEYFTDPENIQANIAAWLRAREEAVERAEYLNEDLGMGGVTKQLCNRLLEPFMWHTVIVTATEWENFFKLRCPQYGLYYEQIPMSFRSKKDLLEYVNKVEAPEFKNQYNNLSNLEWLQINKSQADIHIQAIAELMWDAYNESKPNQLKAGEWHIPNFGHEWDIEELNNIMRYHNSVLTIDDYKVMISTAHNARISYQILGDNPKIDYVADIKLHDRLLAEGHMSPFEHCARVMTSEEYFRFFNGDSEGKFTNEKQFIESFGWCRNFKGFIQYRHLIEQV
jgi:thymidylate synthase ThyX